MTACIVVATFLASDGDYLEAVIEVDGQRLHVMDEFSSLQLAAGTPFQVELWPLPGAARCRHRLALQQEAMDELIAEPYADAEYGIGAGGKQEGAVLLAFGQGRHGISHGGRWDGMRDSIRDCFF